MYPYMDKLNLQDMDSDNSPPPRFLDHRLDAFNVAMEDGISKSQASGTQYDLTADSIPTTCRLNMT
jgi:hypothetical protein